MDATLSLLSLTGAIAIGAMSPGPSFVMVARTAIAASRADGLAAALGMGIGGVAFAGAALLGLHAVLAAVPLLYAVLKAAGGCYLIVLGYGIWRGARAPLDIDAGSGSSAQPRASRAFALGLTTQLGNPKHQRRWTAVAECRKLGPSFPSLLLLTRSSRCRLKCGWLSWPPRRSC